MTVQAFSGFPAIREIVVERAVSPPPVGDLPVNRAPSVNPSGAGGRRCEGWPRKPDSVRPTEVGRTIIFLVPEFPELPSAPKRFRVRLIPRLIPPKRDRTGGPDFALFCLAPRGVCLAPSVALGAVSSYLAFSPLPCRSRAVCFLRHCPSTVAYALRRPRFREARCLVESGLSSGRVATEVTPCQRSSPTSLRTGILHASGGESNSMIRRPFHRPTPNLAPAPFPPGPPARPGEKAALPGPD